MSKITVYKKTYDLHYRQISSQIIGYADTKEQALNVTAYHMANFANKKVTLSSSQLTKLDRYNRLMLNNIPYHHTELTFVKD